MMKHRIAFLLGALALAVGAQTPVTKPAGQAEPRRDLRIELRQIEEGGGGYVVGTQPQAPLLAPQQVQVRNGERATLKLGQSIPVQWTKSVESRAGSLSAGGATASMSGGGVRQEVMWMDAGQSLSVKPTWRGGRQPVTLEVEVQSAGVEPHAGLPAGSNLPAQTRSQLVTTITAPLGEWVTLARTGAAPARGAYSSEAAQSAPRLLQLRVVAP